jgi:micrococcal nuclease
MRWAAAVLGLAVLGLAVLAGCTSDDAPSSSAGPTTERATHDTGPGTVVAPTHGRSRATVVEVVDGDTLDVRLRDGRVEAVRIIGINTPESGECGSEEATDELAALVDGQTLALRRDTSDRDQYDRLLRYVLVGDVSVGEVLVAEGRALSRPYPPDVAEQGALDAAQARAQEARVGLWDPDGCGRASSASVAVGEARTDPPGDESQTPNEEWIEIVSTGGAVDLTGWGVRDESSSHRFAFPDGFRLAAGAAVRIHTGCGPDTAADLHWCVTGSAVWNNDGDTVFLIDPAGNIHDQRSV